ncbi:MAG: undecaprenyl diphosphate synthase family protein, partial [Candidatus Competibacterales bacterium]
PPPPPPPPPPHPPPRPPPPPPQDDLHRFGTALNATMHSSVEAGEVDLLIRTGGDQRLSDFMLWECAYAELLFVDRRWPDFTEEDLAAAVADFTGRERRFGQVGQAL